MEEFLTGELSEDENAAIDRAAELLEELAAAKSVNLPEATEIGRTAYRTLKIPEIAAMCPMLEPEVAVWSQTEDEYLAARADALAIEDGRVTAVIDWKSDVNPSSEDRGAYTKQVDEYRQATGAARAGIVYMTTGEVHWVRE
jgi:hypothetical protein